MRLCVCALGALCALCALWSCTDPRARPIPPDVQIFLGSGGGVTSPGTLVHSVSVYDADGLDSIVVSVVSADSVLVADSSRVPFDALATENYAWTVPAGIAPGTVIRILARAWDFADFQGADTLEILVQDSSQTTS